MNLQLAEARRAYQGEQTQHCWFAGLRCNLPRENRCCERIGDLAHASLEATDEAMEVVKDSKDERAIVGFSTIQCDPAFENKDAWSRPQHRERERDHQPTNLVELPKDGCESCMSKRGMLP